MKLNKFGRFLVLLDTCCNATVTNLLILMAFIVDNCKSDIHTLGGGYNPPSSGYSDLLGEVNFDPHIGMTILSQRKLEKAGAVVTKCEDTYLLKFPNCPVIIEFTWIDDILAGSFEGVYNYYSELKASQTALASWTAHDMDQPSEVLKSYKLIPDMSVSEIRRLDLVHRH